MTSAFPPNAGVSDRGLLSPAYLWATIGSFSLVFLVGFESLAVTTVMPVVSEQLNGASLYALAFAGPLASGVLGMVIAGGWSDRNGPAGPLYASVAVFIAGLLICGLAGNMELLVVGRLVQGLGGGAITVALYVVVARVYPPIMHPKIFAAFAAAWVVPSLVGPLAAGLVAEHIGWRWVFLGVVGLVLIAMIAVVPSLRSMDSSPAAEGKPFSFASLGWAGLAVVAVLGMNLLAEVPEVGTYLMAVSVVITLVAVRPLLPKGTLRAVRGLPATILIRSLAAGAFFGAEVYVPYMLMDHYGLSPSIAGLALTGGALAWSLASAVQGRMGERLPHARAVGIGSCLATAAIALVLVTVVFQLPALVAVGAWVLGGGGMGLVYPRLSVLTLAYSTTGTQGFNSSALAIADSLGAALSLVAAGLVFTSFASIDSFAAVFAFTLVISVVFLSLGHRVVPGHKGLPKVGAGT
ncbi:MFS transporter [Paeniglutamicibacter cryotolerans]|uniref:MFS family permease n=1 Tax=Paeniglutamicibacter cryotolerans TaxID=670079 RepID=A0A839QGN8_9MICC|nr:MFS transporter [Paeniglutamicibacter cryotolerans]MBB2994867.1 MFS family permease [Paeniglutamicibacter cryotolerans]